MSKVRYIEMRPQEFKEAIDRFPVAYLPLGTLEWHGPHMPLGADGIQSEALFLKTAEKVGGVVLPMLYLGPDRYYHDSKKELYGMDLNMGGAIVEYPNQILPGSAYWVNDELFERILLATAANLARQGIKYLVAHGHGPSIWAYLALKDRFYNDYGIKIVSLFDLVEDDKLKFQNDHAAANETAITMTVRPDLVDMSVLKSKEDMVAMAGADPIEFASIEYGEALMETNVAALSQWLLANVE